MGVERLTGGGERYFKIRFWFNKFKALNICLKFGVIRNYCNKSGVQS
jgi:hypothetical protein